MQYDHSPLTFLSEFIYSKNICRNTVPLKKKKKKKKKFNIYMLQRVSSFCHYPRAVELQKHACFQLISLQKKSDQRLCFLMQLETVKERKSLKITGRTWRKSPPNT